MHRGAARPANGAPDVDAATCGDDAGPGSAPRPAISSRKRSDLGRSQSRSRDPRRGPSQPGRTSANASPDPAARQAAEGPSGHGHESSERRR
eukprot:2683719-Alexandrium_andersonii.AAC.1